MADIRATSARENEAGYSAGARRGSSILKDPSQGGWEYSSNIYDNNASDYDPDLYRAAILQRFLRGEGGLNGLVRDYAGDTGSTVANSAMNKYLAQAGQRKELKGQLSGLPALQQQDEQQTIREGEAAIGQGVKHTRQNFNNRGLLYGGMREGGEGAVKAQGAAQLASNIAGVRQDYAKKADATKQAIASIGLANQQAQLQMQQQVTETSMRNAVARQQAMQQLGEGVGYAAGAYYGSREKTTETTPSAGYSGMASNSRDARYIRPGVE